MLQEVFARLLNHNNSNKGHSFHIIKLKIIENKQR